MLLILPPDTTTNLPDTTTLQRQYCWSTFLEKSKYWFDNYRCSGACPGEKNVVFYPADFVKEKYMLESNVIWRHIAIVFDETNDYFRLYYDGALAYTGPFGAAVTSMDDCAATGTNWDNKLFLGRDSAQDGSGWYDCILACMHCFACACTRTVTRIHEHTQTYTRMNFRH